MLKTTAAASVMLTVTLFCTVSYADTPRANNAVVRDSAGNIVRAISNDTCVRTNWVVGEDSCAPQMSVRTLTHTVLTEDERIVFFDFDKSDLTQQAKNNLQSLAQRLQKAQDVASAQVVGFADRIGSSDYNQRLSARRAQTVRDFLVEYGYLNVDVTEVRALGETVPVTNCPNNIDRDSQITCLSPDRRVEIELTYVDRQVTTTFEPKSQDSRAQKMRSSIHINTGQ